MTEKPRRGRPRGFNKPGQSSTIQSLDRAMLILRLLSISNGLALKDVAEGAAQSPATAYRVLTTLQTHDMVDFDEAEQLWYIGVGAFRIGSSFVRRTSLLEQSRGQMQTLMQTTGETANLAIEDKDHVLFIAQVETHEPIRAFFRPGTRTPMHMSGIGKAMMAHYAADKLNLLLDRGLEAVTPNTIVDPDALRADLARCRRRGYAIDDEERTMGMRCIASPVFNAFGEAIAGISISGPSVRVTHEKAAEMGRHVVRTAAKVTAATGGLPPGE